MDNESYNIQELVTVRPTVTIGVYHSNCGTYTDAEAGIEGYPRRFRVRVYRHLSKNKRVLHSAYIELAKLTATKALAEDLSRNIPAMLLAGGPACEIIEVEF